MAVSLRIALAWMLVLLGTGMALATDYGTAIDKAGRQRMLSQRIVKAYCQLGLELLPGISANQLTAAIDRFEGQLATLRELARSPGARQAVEELAAAWEPLRALAAAPVSGDRAVELDRRAEAVLHAADRLTRLLQRESGTPEGRLVNLSGRQRMLSQRLAKLYMLHLLVPGEDRHAAMDTASREFAAAIEELRAAPENTPAIARELESVALQWEWFQTALALEGAISYRLVVADASESILNSLELVTGLYADLARGVSPAAAPAK